MRVGIIGAGTMARVHAEAIGKIEGAEIAGFGVRSVPEATGELAAELGVPIMSPEEILNREDVDAVVVAVPTDVHRDFVVAAAEAGKDVFCEKPLARTLQDAQEMLDAARQAKVKLAVGHVVRYFPEYAMTRDLVAKGEIGTPGVARVTRGAGFPRGRGDWYAFLERSGGVVLDMMIHDFDWLRWTFGPVERVQASGLRSGLPDHDAAMVILRFTGGAMAYAEGNWCYPSGFRTTLEVSGSEALITTTSRDTTPLSFELAPVESGVQGVEVPTGGLEEDPYLVQMRDVLEWFDGGGEPRSSPKDAFEALWIGLAALESLRTGQPVTLGGDQL